MDRGVAVFLDQSLGQQDGVFKVITVPGHERDQHILPERQFAHIGGGAIGQHIASGDLIAGPDQRLLVDAGILIGAGIFGQVIYIDARLARHDLGVIDPHHDPAGVNGIDLAAPIRDHRHARIDGHLSFHARAHQRLVGQERWHGLTLHVGTHERAVGVVMLQKRDQGGGHGDDLARRHIHIIDARGGRHGKFILMTAGYQRVQQPAVGVQRGAGLGDHIIALFDSGQVFDIVRDPALDHFTIRRLQKAILIGPGVNGQRVNQADIGPLGRLDGTDAAIMGGMHIAHLKTGPLAGQAARPQGRDAPLVGDFRERVILIHELRQLAGAEELLDHGRDRLGIDDLLRHQALRFGQIQAFLDGPLDPDQANTELVFHHLAHASDPAIAQVINIVHAVLAVANIDQHLHHGDNVLGAEHAFAGDLLAPDPAVELHAPDRGQIIALGAEEQILKQIFGRVTGGRLAGPHHAVDLDLRLQLAGGRIIAQGIGDVGAMIEVISINSVEFQRLAGGDFFQQFLGQLGIGRKFDLAGFGVNDVSGEHLAQQEFAGDRQGAETRLFNLANMPRIDALVALDNHLALVVLDIKRRHLALPAIGDPCHTELPGLDLEGVLVKKQFQHLGGGITQGAQQDGRVDLAAPVDAAVQQVLGIEFQVQP